MQAPWYEEPKATECLFKASVLRIE